ncbi:hypothetical protein D3C73_1548230 [compost metagenome]
MQVREIVNIEGIETPIPHVNLPGLAGFHEQHKKAWLLHALLHGFVIYRILRSK